MQFLRPTSSPAKTALIYITVGTLTMVWTAVYYFYRLNNNTDGDPVPYYWITGFMATGLALLVIGLATGQIGRAARPAEAAPPAIVTTPAVADAAQPAVAQAPASPVAVNPNPVNQAAPVAVAPAGVNNQQAVRG